MELDQRWGQGGTIAKMSTDHIYATFQNNTKALIKLVKERGVRRKIDILEIKPSRPYLDGLWEATISMTDTNSENSDIIKSNWVISLQLIKIRSSQGTVNFKVSRYTQLIKDAY